MFFCAKYFLRICPLLLASLSADTSDEVQPQQLDLETAIQTALENNLGLSAQRYGPANAQDALIAAESAFDPIFFGNTSLSERQSPARSSALDDFVLPTSENRALGTGVSKRLSTGANVTIDTGISRQTTNNNAARNPDYSSDVGFRVQQPLLKDAWSTVNLAPIARAKAQADQSLYQLRSDILDLMSETEIAYWNLAYAQADRDLVESSIELANNLLEENKERERLGYVTPLEVLQAQTEVFNQEENRIRADRVIEEAMDQLRDLMGKQSFFDSLTPTLEVSALPTISTEVPELDAIVRASVANDADAAAQELQIEVQRINRLLAQDETRPDLNLNAGLNYSGRDTDGRESYRGAYQANGYGWNVGLEVSIPWGLRDAKARLRQAKRGLEREELELYALKQQKALAARTAWRSLSTGVKRVEVTRKALELNEQTFEQERARYGSGLSAYRRVLEAQRDFDRARRNYLSAIIETLRARVRLGRIDGSILERNGYSWSLLDKYVQEPDLVKHPLATEMTD